MNAETKCLSRTLTVGSGFLSTKKSTLLVMAEKIDSIWRSRRTSDVRNTKRQMELSAAIDHTVVSLMPCQLTVSFQEAGGLLRTGIHTSSGSLYHNHHNAKHPMITAPSSTGDCCFLSFHTKPRAIIRITYEAIRNHTKSIKHHRYETIRILSEFHPKP